MLSGIVCAILMLCCVVPSLATIHTVGDSTGWTTNVDYSTWISGKTFVVGDSLVFNYGGEHMVAEVSASDYASCTLGNSISTATDGNESMTITLTTVGTHYFICGNTGHCANGMKLAVPIIGGRGGEGAISTPPTSPPSNSSTTPGNTTSRPPTYSYSSSVTLSQSTAILFIWVVANWQSLS